MERDAESQGSVHDVADQADRLSWLLYGRKASARDLIGGSNALILSDAASSIEGLREALGNRLDAVSPLALIQRERIRREGASDMAIIDEIAFERQRQKTVEGWTPAHDDTHVGGEMALAAAAYAAQAIQPNRAFEYWPREWAQWWKPKGHRQNLVRAAAMIVAEIERIDRATQNTK